MPELSVCTIWNTWRGQVFPFSFLFFWVTPEENHLHGQIHLFPPSGGHLLPSCFPSYIAMAEHSLGLEQGMFSSSHEAPQDVGICLLKQNCFPFSSAGSEDTTASCGGVVGDHLARAALQEFKIPKIPRIRNSLVKSRTMAVLDKKESCACQISASSGW